MSAVKNDEPPLLLEQQVACLRTEVDCLRHNLTALASALVVDSNDVFRSGIVHCKIDMAKFAEMMKSWK